MLDRVELFDDFDPREHYQLTVGDSEMLDVERNLSAGAGTGVSSLDGIDLDLGTDG